MFSKQNFKILIKKEVINHLIHAFVNRSSAIRPLLSDPTKEKTDFSLIHEDQLIHS